VIGWTISPLTSSVSLDRVAQATSKSTADYALDKRLVLLGQLVAAAFPRATVVAASMARAASRSEPTSRLFVHSKAGRGEMKIRASTAASVFIRGSRGPSMSFHARCAACLYLMTTFLGQVAFASESCPIGEMSCPAGATAPGGCFKPSISSCQDGLICPAPLRICKRGSIGPGACFYAGQYICDLGRLRGLSAPAPTHRDACQTDCRGRRLGRNGSRSGSEG
jgi:hypothetical protein